MIAEKRTFSIGLALFVSFTVILIMMFSPIFGGQNALRFLDDLYNSISKGSAYYIPAVKEESNAFAGREITVLLEMESDQQARQTVPLYEQGGATATVSGHSVSVSGDLGTILFNCLNDADVMYNNDADKIKEKYGYDERQVLYNWWLSLKVMDKELSKQKMFKEAKCVSLVQKKAVETSYNYYGVEPQKITDRLAVVTFSLIFYVIYTVWYGYAIMYMFEGWGLRLSH